MRKSTKILNKTIAFALCAALAAAAVGIVPWSSAEEMTSAELAEIRKEIGSKLDAIDSDLSGLQSEAGDIEDQMNELMDKLNENADETKAVVDQKYDLDQQADLIRQQVENTNAQIQEYNKLIAQRQMELDLALEQEATMQERYQERVRVMEEDGKVSYLQILFNAASFTDFLDRLDMIKEIAESDQLAIANLEKAREDVAQAQEQLQSEKEALSSAKEQLAQQELQLEEKREEANSLISNLGFEAEGYQDEYSVYESQEEQLRAEILEMVAQYDAMKAEYDEALAEENAAIAREEEEKRQREAAAAAAAASSKVSSTTSDAQYYSNYSTDAVKESGFLTPLSSYVVTCAFGPRIHPITGSYGNHTGVDLAANSGTNIYASKSGTVIVAAVSSAYGNYVVISHGSGQATLYAHMSSMAVSSGDYVAQGQLIGYVGSTGWSTGPHLHFEVIIDGEYVNPMNYIG